MAKDKLTDYSATNASNTDVGGINIDEGMLPSDVNNAIREVMTHLKDFSDGTSGVDVLNLQDDDASASIKIQAPAAVTTTTTFTLPDGDGTSGQVLQTNGTGTLSWTSNGLANVVEDTSPQLGGDLDTNGNDINFGDNDKAIFGAGSDLQIYHDGSNSIIGDFGTGNLKLQTDGTVIALQSSTGENMLLGTVNSDVKLYYDNAEKLATTSGGIDVTGTVTADGLTVSGTGGTKLLIENTDLNWAALELNANTNQADYIFFKDDTAERARITVLDTNEFNIANGSSPTNRFKIASNGDISFYDSTGVSQNFFWDSSASRLTLSSSDYHFGIQQGGNQAWYLRGVSDGSFRLHLNGTGDIVTATSSGNVGIGTSSPVSRLEIEDAGTASSVLLKVTADDQSPYGIVVGNDIYSTSDTDGLTLDVNNSGVSSVRARGTGSVLKFDANGSERLRIDSSGNLQLGKTASGIATDGITLYGDGAKGAADFTRDGGRTLALNRKTSDGDIMEFRKDGTTVGSIGTLVGRLSIGTDDTGLFFDAIYNQVRPFNLTANDVSDAAIDLGRGSSRFKDLYLSGGVYVGGTGSANYLDDYEEGTWTPKFTDHTGSDRFSSYNLQTGTYSKIGNTCFCGFDIIGATGAVTSGTYLGIGNLPFNVQSGSNATCVFNISYMTSTGYSTIQGGFANNNPNFIYLISSGSTYVGPGGLTSGSRMIGGFVYLTE